MFLKNVVDDILKEKNRSMSWLAEEMGKTFDGLKLSLKKGSIKYNDIILMAKVLEVSTNVFFENQHKVYGTEPITSNFSEPKADYADMKINLKNCREMLATLKDQIKDKEKIIALLSEKS